MDVFFIWPPATSAPKDRKKRQREEEDFYKRHAGGMPFEVPERLWQAFCAGIRRICGGKEWTERRSQTSIAPVCTGCTGQS